VEIEEFLKQLEYIWMTFGIIGGVMVIVVIFSTFLLTLFLQKKIEKVAEEASEKSLKKFQNNLDKDAFKFQAKHQRQINTIQEVYQKLQDVISIIRFVRDGEKFYDQMHPQDEINALIKRRHSFKKFFFKNKLVFTSSLKIKIEEIIPVIDEFIDDYIEGVFPEFKREGESEAIYSEMNGERVQIAGIWASDKLDIMKLENISNDIENEFRILLGVEE
jgi:hypothetical protein